MPRLGPRGCWERTVVDSRTSELTEDRKTILVGRGHLLSDRKEVRPPRLELVPWSSLMPTSTGSSRFRLGKKS